MKDRAYLYLSPDVARALRIRAAEEGRSMSEIVEELLRRELGIPDRVLVRIPTSEAVAHMRGEHEEPAWLVIQPDGRYEWRWGRRRPPTLPGGWVVRGPVWQWEGPEPEPEGDILEQAQLEQVQLWAEEVEEAEEGLRIEIRGDNR